MADAGRAGQAPVAARGGQEARPPQARARARPLRLPRHLARRALLAAERLDDRAWAAALRARSARRPGLSGDLDAAPREQEALGAVRSLGSLSREHVPRRVRGADRRPQADELPRVVRGLPPGPALVPRPAA